MLALPRALRAWQVKVPHPRGGVQEGAGQTTQARPPSLSPRVTAQHSLVAGAFLLNNRSYHSLQPGRLGQKPPRPEHGSGETLGPQSGWQRAELLTPWS